MRANLLFLKNDRPQIIPYLAVYHSSQDFKNSDSSSSEDEQEKVVHQEPANNSMRENEHQIIRDYIYNWKMNLENGLKKAKDHVLKKSSCTMKKKFEELKELSEFNTMLKSSIDDFEHELSKVFFFNF